MWHASVVRRLLVVAVVLLAAACGGDRPTVSTAAPTTTGLGPMGTLHLVTSDGTRTTFAQLIEDRGLVAMPTDFGTLWYEASTHGGFMAGDCHGVTPEQVDPDGERVEVIACYGADGRDEVNERVG